VIEKNMAGVLKIMPGKLELGVFKNIVQKK
jgi:hypothetical protein